MKSEKEQIADLITFLSTVGFTGPALEEKLAQHIRSKSKKFQILHHRPFGEEQMRFVLDFQYDLQFNAVRLNMYHAIYRKHISINHKVIDGLDTKDLEEAMKQIDWETTYLNAETNDNRFSKEYVTILAKLYILSQSNDYDGINIQNLLMAKYLPVENLNDASKRTLQSYETSKEFSVGPEGVCKVQLAYSILSGRLDNLYYQFQKLCIEEYPGIDLMPLLTDKLSSEQKDFEITYNYFNPEGLVSISIPVTCRDGVYLADNYTLSITPYKSLKHGLHNGIDSQKLEAQIMALYGRDKLEFYRDDETLWKKLLESKEDVQLKLTLLAKSKKGAAIAAQLKLKSFSYPPTEKIEHESFQGCLNISKKREQGFPIEMEIKRAENLLCGRPAKDLTDAGVQSRQWVRLDLSKKDNSGNYPYITIEGNTDTEIIALMYLLPGTSRSFYPLKRGLIRGDILPIVFDNGKEILAVANPEQKSLNLFTPAFAKIPFNFHFDPDWHSQKHGIAAKHIHSKNPSPGPAKAPKKVRRKPL